MRIRIAIGPLFFTKVFIVADMAKCGLCRNKIGAVVDLDTNDVTQITTNLIKEKVIKDCVS